MSEEKLDLEFGLAPMEGVSELPFRLWLSQTSAPAYSSTPFLRATDTFPRALPADFAPELDSYRELVNYRLIPQIMAASPHDFVRTARLFLERTDFVDLNAGCPSPNPISGGAGSALLKEPERFADFMKTLADQLPERSFSLKMRTGFDDNEQFFAYIDSLRSIPLKRLTIHGRTRRDRYDHRSRWDLIERAAAGTLPGITVVASGDIVSHATALERSREAPSVRNAIVGRGALRNPWIFAELRSGREQKIARELLIDALACLGLWFEAHHQDNPRLDELIRSGCFRASCGSDPEQWRLLYERSVRTLRGVAIEAADLHFERPIMGRVKMVWNSFRSSLPSAYFSPILLRSHSYAEWASAWREMGDEILTVKHQCERDWLYTSSKQKSSEILPQ